MKKVLLSIIAIVFCIVGANGQDADADGLRSNFASAKLDSESSILPQPNQNLPFIDYKQAALQYVNN